MVGVTVGVVIASVAGIDVVNAELCASERLTKDFWK